MKATLLLLAPVVLFVSCNQNSDSTPVAPAVNSGNPYGVPAAQPTGAYNPVNPPYQPVAPINPPASPYGTPPPAGAYGSPPPAPVPAIPSAPAPSPELNGNVYTIQKGDSLWGISRKFGTSVEAIQQVNGLTGDTIVDGRTLIIPGR